MTAAGKTTAARITTGDRILVKHYTQDNEADRATLEYLGKERALGISATKTGAGVTVARVLSVEAIMVTGGRRDRRVYEIHTTEGTIRNNAPAQTLTLAPEDAAGIKRAYAEALAEDADRTAAAERAAQAQAEMDEATANQATPQWRYFAEATRKAGGYAGGMRALEIEAHAELADRNWAARVAAKRQEDSKAYREELAANVKRFQAKEDEERAAAGETHMEAEERHKDEAASRAPLDVVAKPDTEEIIRLRQEYKTAGPFKRVRIETRLAYLGAVLYPEGTPEYAEYRQALTEALAAPGAWDFLDA